MLIIAHPLSQIAKFMEIFVPTPDIHISNTIIQRGFKKRKSLEQLCDESEELFGKVFDFSTSVYNGSKKEILIICGIHKEFIIRIRQPFREVNMDVVPGNVAMPGHPNEDNKLTKDKVIDT